MTLKICDLRDEAQYSDLVRDRIWHAWWEPDGSSISDLEQGLAEVAAAEHFPSFTLIATEEEHLLGTVTGIQSDIEARPELGPCIAALWVEEAERRRGIGTKLIDAACARFSASGFSLVYLAAKPSLRNFYSHLGWHLLESHIGADDLDVFSRALR
jgi:predicted N-acetyltransferase YhbS